MRSNAKLAAVVLAAGASTRMGRSKPRLTWRGRPFVVHAIALARAADCAPVVVVQGADPLVDLVGASAWLVDNPAWPSGPLSSLQSGLARALRGGGPTCAGVLVLTVDRPHVRVSTMRALRRAVDDAPTRIWQPMHDGRHGHPIVYPRDVAERLLGLAADRTPRDVLHAADVTLRRGFVTVDDPAVLDNLDHRADLERLR